MPQLEINSVITAALCFAVGFGACLLVVYYLLPSLVYAQCVEIVRDYLDHAKPDADIRVVVLDRDSHAPLQKPRRAVSAAETSIAEPVRESQKQYVRVDQPNAPASGAPDGTQHVDAPNSMLTQIYEQNLHLRDQLRKQSRSVKQ